MRALIAATLLLAATASAASPPDKWKRWLDILCHPDYVGNKDPAERSWHIVRALVCKDREPATYETLDTLEHIKPKGLNTIGILIDTVDRYIVLRPPAESKLETPSDPAALRAQALRDIKRAQVLEHKDRLQPVAPRGVEVPWFNGDTYEPFELLAHLLLAVQAQQTAIEELQKRAACDPYDF